MGENGLVLSLLRLLYICSKDLRFGSYKAQKAAYGPGEFSTSSHINNTQNAPRVFGIANSMPQPLS